MAALPPVLSNCSFNLLGLVKALPLPVRQSAVSVAAVGLIITLRSFGELFQRLACSRCFFTFHQPAASSGLLCWLYPVQSAPILVAKINLTLTVA
jgi:hypothetical protein